MQNLISTIRPYQQKIENAIQAHISVQKTHSQLEAACAYALIQGGKRFRPALVMMVAKALGDRYYVLQSALAIEFFHTASLIADDLPCMDNDAFRRGEPATHKVYGEAVALLASYALIADGYQAIAANTEILRREGNPLADRIGMLALENATYNTGIQGATGGQYIDLFPPKNDMETYTETILKKTVSLFEISMVFGWLFGGGAIADLPAVKKAAYHYGVAFQIADDIGDAAIDAAGNRAMNAVTLLGLERSIQMVHTEIQAYLAHLKELKIDSAELKALAEYLLTKLTAQTV